MRLCKEENHEFLKISELPKTRQFSNRVHLLYANLPQLLETQKIYSEVKRFIVPVELAQKANFIWKHSKTKWYVKNTEPCNAIKFFKRNNLVAWDFSIDSSYRISDILEICEVVLGTQEFLNNNQKILKEWAGDFVLLYK